MKCYDKFLDGLIALAAVIALAVCLCHQAKAEPVPTTEWVYQGTALVDTLQTLSIAGHPMQWQEVNPVLGPHPSKGAVLGYFAATGLLHFAITKEIVNGHVPGVIVQGWECATIALEVGAVAHNFHVGVRIQF
jgi:hypothetical protein